jgi:uncharacterized protein YuzE
MEGRYLRVVLLADGETVHNAFFDVDRRGNICAITIEHASERADLPHFSFEQVGA